MQKDGVLVFNDTKVIKAKLVGFSHKTRIEVNLHKRIQENIWQVTAGGFKKLKIDHNFKISDNFCAKVVKKHENGFIDLEFNCKSNKFHENLEKYGQVPLPLCIKRKVK